MTDMHRNRPSSDIGNTGIQNKSNFTSNNFAHNLAPRDTINSSKNYERTSKFSRYELVNTPGNKSPNPLMNTN
jgi:hypothetical protein